MSLIILDAAPCRPGAPETRSLPPNQPHFFEPPPAPPGALRYQADFLTESEERSLIAQFAELDFTPFQFRGYEGKRRVIAYGWRYDPVAHQLGRTQELAPFLIPLRAAAARFAGLAPRDLQQAMITEYAPGAAIGWHRDRPEFSDIIGISFGAPCQFRLRRRSGGGWERTAFPVQPRSAYLLRGAIRSAWEHSIPAQAALRYSVTFRSLAALESVS